MKKFLTICALSASVLVAPTYVGLTDAHAQSCSARAAQVAAQRGGKVLSASAKGSKCRITLLVKSSNKPPKRVTVVVAK